MHAWARGLTVDPMKTSPVSLVLSLALLSGAASAQEPAQGGQGAPQSAPQGMQPPQGTPPAPPAALPPSSPVAPSPEPSSGTVLLVLGSLGIVAGVGNLVSAPVCLSSAIKASAHTPCLGLSLGFGAGFLAAGIPLVVLGAQRRSTWQEWTKGARVGMVPGGAVGAWTATW